MRVAIAGASGFIGMRLMDALLQSGHHSVAALSRRGLCPDHPLAKGVSVDFFSLASAEEALGNIDVGIYLLHSMTPSSRLAQGRFEDFDFILADNFARAAKKNGIQQIIYVSGMMDDADAELSRHLASRLEVEKVLGAYGIPLTSVRCSLVIGSEGSSFLILRNLVARLPSMILPSWCQTPCQPVAVEDLVDVLSRAIGEKLVYGKSIDCGSPEVLTYRSLIESTARAAGWKRRIVEGIWIPQLLSKLWVRLVSGAPKSLVYPLIESLGHPMLVRKDHDARPLLIKNYTPIQDALEKALEQPPKRRGWPRLFGRPSVQVREQSLVKSVQRLPLPEGMSAERVARLYFKWLSRFFTFFLNVTDRGDQASFHLFRKGPPLLVLSFSPSRSTPDRQLFYITGGLLALVHDRGRLEFRESPDRQWIFAAIHDFRPSLPWWLYRLSQAPFHRFVMWSFGRFLARYAGLKTASKTKERFNA